MKSKFRKILFAFLAILACLIIWQWDILKYGIQQGIGQADVILNAKPIDDFLNDPDFPDSLKQKLQLSKEVRKFALDELDLNASDNYTKLYDQKGKVLLWNLSASEPYSLEPHMWFFPFLGNMPYKGFFDLEKAKAEKQVLDSLGLDTRIRPVSGWSTLGILSDPLLSNMLERTDGELAEVIIHELTHATIFVRDEIEFNENLASFIGEKGAAQFLAKQFGDNSEVLLEYLHDLEDSRTFTHQMLRGAKSLNDFYTTLDGEEDSIKRAKKDAFIRQIINSLDTLDFHNPVYKQLYQNRIPNNAYFMSLIRYHGQEDTLNTLYSQSNNNLSVFIQKMKEVHGK